MNTKQIYDVIDTLLDSHQAMSSTRNVYNDTKGTKIPVLTIQAILGKLEEQLAAEEVSTIDKLIATKPNCPQCNHELYYEAFSSTFECPNCFSTVAPEDL